MKFLQPFPMNREPNHKSEASFRRARSVDTNAQREIMNVHEGIENRQRIKITNYAKSDMKKPKLLLSAKLTTENKEEYSANYAVLAELEKENFEQQNIIKRLQENYQILERQLMPKEELIKYCRKLVEEDWNTRKEGLLDQVIRDYLPTIEEKIRNSLKSEFENRKNLMENSISSYISSKILPNNSDDLNK